MQPGTLRHRIALENPGPPVADNDGGFTQSWTPLIPSPVSASITPATARDLEQITAGTVLALASHIIRMRYHSGVTTKTRITKGPRNANGTLPSTSREFSVTGVMNPEERNLETVILAVEIVQ